jgi:hypothetical protein
VREHQRLQLNGDEAGRPDPLEQTEADKDANANRGEHHCRFRREVLMRSFGDLDRLICHVPAAVATGLRTIDTGSGSAALYRNQLPASLTELANRVRVESITALSAI